jgi:hypothetical protein
MTAPVYNSIPIGGFIPILKRTISTQSTNLLLHDFYPEVFQRMGILRDEMIAVVKAYTTTDPLVGTAVLRYIGEDTSIKDDTKITPM